MYDVVVVGAGAAGLMAAIQAGKRNKKVLLLEHTNKIGEKIRISGGGRCNFTNLNASSDNYISKNPHFAKSALAGFTQRDFIKLIESYNIKYHEKTLGQLFCDGSATQIINMLLSLCEMYQVEVKTNCVINKLNKESCFEIYTNQGLFKSYSVIIATGGLSIPKLGASDLGYKIANQFNLNIVQTKPALVPLIILDQEFYRQLSGVSNYSIVKYRNNQFKENILFTHRGLSGPSILQISSYLEDFKESIEINLIPNIDLKKELLNNRQSKQVLKSYIKNYIPKSVADVLFPEEVFNKRIAEISKEQLLNIGERINSFKININGSEGYQKAEVTVGGVDTDELSSKTMEVKKVSNLFFIGEVVDVTGWLGGYNFQWAWSSGFAAGNNC